MIGFYLRNSWRNLRRDKLVTVINICCLSIGFACAVLAILYARHELSYESAHENADRICKVFTAGKFGNLGKIPVTYGKVSRALESAFPEIKKCVRSRTVNGLVYQNNMPVSEDDIVISEMSLFSLFTLPLKHGTLPEDAGAVLISETMASKYFGNKNPLNEIITIGIFGQKIDFTVSGVMKDLPTNTHLKASFIIPFDLAYRLNWNPDNYYSTEYSAYTLLEEGTDIQALNNKIASALDIPVSVENIHVVLEPVKRIHLHENIRENTKTNLMTLLIGGCVALFISIFNYLNLTTVVFSTRLKEAGIKKVVGGKRLFLFLQFLSDTLVTAGLGFGFAFAIVSYILPRFRSVLDSQFMIEWDLTKLLLLSSLFLITVLLAGVYPALKVSKSRPVELLQYGMPHTGKSRLRDVLLTAQFVIAIVFIQFLIISQRQSKHMFAEEVTGFNAENVICMNGRRWGDLNVVKQELLKHSAVQTVSWGNTLPSGSFNLTNDWKETGNKEMAIRVVCEEDYAELFRIEVLKGNFFSEKFPGDLKNGVVINSLTAQSLGYINPVGHTMNINGRIHKIIGISDDYSAMPPMYKNMPLLMIHSDAENERLFIRVSPDAAKEAHKHIKAVLRSANPDFPVEIKYYKDLMAEYGKTFVATGIFFNAFTLIILINAMIGLFGLSFFIAQRNTKETGIRKICGARLENIYWKLSRGNVLKFILAFSLATPISYLMGKAFLSAFGNQINLRMDIFILGGFWGLLMLLTATGWKTLQTAKENPVEALRYE